MTDSERQQILRMIDEGKISAQQGLILMRALDEEPNDDSDDDNSAGQPDQDVVQPGGLPAEMHTDEKKSDPDFERKLNRFRSLWVIPLWVGVVVTIAGAYWMYSALQSSGFSPWFYLSWVPFLFGVMLTALGFSSRTSRWIYVNVKQKPGETPQRIIIAFPFSLVGWVVNLVKLNIPQRERSAVEEVMQAVFNSTNSTEPLFVDVTDDDGEHVQVYIG